MWFFKLVLEVKRNNINTAIETCGYIKWEKLELLLDKIDLILFDLKHIDNEKHKIYTGVSNKIILENLEKLLKSKKDVIVRLTLIPGFNDSKIEKEKIKNLLASWNRNVKVEYLQYHEYGKFKYNLLDRPYEFNKNKKFSVV